MGLVRCQRARFHLCESCRYMGPFVGHDLATSKSKSVHEYSLVLIAEEGRAFGVGCLG